MTRDEFKLWADDLMKRFPDLGEHVAKLTRDVRDKWFEDIFEGHEFNDAMAMNRRWFETGEGVGRWERDKLPSLFIRSLAEVKHARESKARSRVANRTGELGPLGAYRIIEEDSQCAFVYKTVVNRMAEYREANGVRYTPSDLIHDWCDEAWECVEAKRKGA